MSHKTGKILLAELLGHRIEYQMVNPPRPVGVHFRGDSITRNSGVAPFDTWEPSQSEREEAFLKMEKIKEFLNQ